MAVNWLMVNWEKCKSIVFTISFQPFISFKIHLLQIEVIKESSKGYDDAQQGEREREREGERERKREGEREREREREKERGRY